MSRVLPPGAGKSSFELVDTRLVFRELSLKSRMIFLDMACGRGEYALAASEIIGTDGIVYAIDLWEEGIESLRKEVLSRGVRNIDARTIDLGNQIPIEDNRIDVCLLATVLHDLVDTNVAPRALSEAARVLKPKGRLVIVEYKKMEGPPGPPIHIRLSPDGVERYAGPYGFIREDVVDLGPYHYLIKFMLEKAH